MLADRHRIAAVIALSQVPEAERAAHQDALETLLVHLYHGATPAAREAFRKRMDPVPASQKPWGALVRPSPAQWLGLGPPVPAVALLVRGQQDDDPDSAEDGNRLPDRDSKAGEPWVPLYVALDRWDTAAILRHIGPTGWRVPLVRPVPLDQGFDVEVVPSQVVLKPSPSGLSPTTVPPGNGTPAPSNGTPAPSHGTPAPAPANGSPPAPEPAPLWRHPAVLGGAAVAGTLLITYALTRPHAPTRKPLPEVPNGPAV
jgi:hypothetical protein